MSRNVLAIGAHPDDIELGCGGALITHVSAGDHVTMLVITKGEVGPGRTSVRISEQERSCAVMGVDALIWGDLPDCQVSLHELSLVHLIEKAIATSGADLVYTHSIADSHQDHRAVAVNTMGAARACSNILSYDAPSSLGFRPSVFADVSAAIDKKLEALMCHESQVEASDMVHPFRVRNSAGYRGHEARVEAAEAFEPMRLLLAI